jgi:hypothetical protein
MIYNKKLPPNKNYQGGEKNYYKSLNVYWIVEV